MDECLFMFIFFQGQLNKTIKMITKEFKNIMNFWGRISNFSYFV
jgi:hypothetical protein